MSPASALHILEQSDYSRHHLVPHPAEHLPPLAPSSIRLIPVTLGLTTNNFSYARLGHIMGWWDIYPIPADTPAPYNDTSKYCRIAAWGHAEIVESTVSDIPVGHTVYAFLTTGTLPFDVTVERTGLKNQIKVTNPHRQHLWTIYNRCQICPPLSELLSTKGLDDLGWDALMQGLFATSYNLSTYGFAWKDENRIHPWGEGEWSAEDANLDDATVIILNASGKTGMSFAYTLRRNRPKEHQPRLIVGVGSNASRDTIEGSGFYDKTVLNSDAQALKAELEQSPPRRVVLLDFGAREGAQQQWKDALSSTSIPYQYISVGGEVKPLSPEESTQRLQEMSAGVVVHASNLREKGIENGGDKYFETFYADWDEFKKSGAIPGIKLVWGEGMEGWTEGWDKLCKDEVSSKTGLVYRV